MARRGRAHLHSRPPPPLLEFCQENVSFCQGMPAFAPPSILAPKFAVLRRKHAGTIYQSHSHSPLLAIRSLASSRACGLCVWKWSGDLQIRMHNIGRHGQEGGGGQYLAKNQSTPVDTTRGAGAPPGPAKGPEMAPTCSRSGRRRGESRMGWARCPKTTQRTR